MARREKMDEDALAALVDAQITDARQFAASDLVEGRDKAIEYVRGIISDIQAETGKSSVTDRSLSDVLEWIMPGLLRVFLASDQVVRYEPSKQQMERDESGQPVDRSKERSDQATDYVNYAFLAECAGYRVVQSALYDGLLMGNGVIKHWWDETPEYKTDDFSGLTDDEYHYLISHPDVEKVLEHSAYPDDSAAPQQLAPPVGGAAEPDIGAGGPAGNGMAGDESPPPGNVAPQPPESGGEYAGLSQEVSGPALLHDCKIKRRISSGRLRVEALPPEEFLIERNAKALDETVRFCAHFYQSTRSDLIKQGYDREKIEDMGSGSNTIAFDQANASRDGSYLPGSQHDGPDKSTEMVDVYECYVLCDYDGDGIAERRRIVMSGGMDSRAILENEEWCDDLPFSDLVPNPVPHRWKGRSLFDDLEDIVRIKTVLLRQTLDNLYQVNNPMNEILENSVVNMDALINREIGANVFVKSKGAITPLPVEFTAAASFQMLEYCDQLIEKRTGVSRSTMGMDPDALQNQTAEAVRDSRAASTTKNETFARNMAELGMKRMFRSILKLVTAHQDRPRTIHLRGKWVEMDPTVWDAGMGAHINTGLGTGSRDRDLGFMQAIIGQQKEILLQMGPSNKVAGLDKLSNALIKATELMGIKNPQQFWGEVTEQDVAQLAQQPPPDPKMAEAQAKMQLEQQKAQHDAQMTQAKAAADMEHRQQEMQAKAGFDREKAGADLQLARDKAAAEIQAMREKHQLELELAREKAQQEAQLKIHELSLEAELRREEMHLNAQASMHQTNVNANIKQATPQ